MARAAVAYDDESRDLILGFKHADRLEMAPLFARWLSGLMFCPKLEQNLIIPVPLHWTRLSQRRYNQAAVLAHAISRNSGLDVVADGLVRIQKTLSQGAMPSAKARLKNVARAFAVSEQSKQKISGKNIILVDDVLTTGATVSACTKTLLRAGAASVSVITIARVVRPLSF